MVILLSKVGGLSGPSSGTVSGEALMGCIVALATVK
jgi:hypothetical protein